MAFFITRISVFYKEFFIDGAVFLKKFYALIFFSALLSVSGSLFCSAACVVLLCLIKKNAPKKLKKNSIYIRLKNKYLNKKNRNPKKSKKKYCIYIYKYYICVRVYDRSSQK